MSTSPGPPDVAQCQSAFEEFKSHHTTQRALKQAVVSLFVDLAKNKTILIGLIMNHPNPAKLNGKMLVDVTVNSEKQMTMYFRTNDTPEVLSDTVSWVSCVKHSARKRSGAHGHALTKGHVHRM